MGKKNFLAELKEKFSDAWLRLCVNLYERTRAENATYLYWLLGATALGEVVNAPSYTAGVLALTKLLGNFGVEALSNLLEDFRKSKDENERFRLLQAAAQNSEAVRQALDELLEKMGALKLALEGFNQKHPNEAERQWFGETLQQALKQAGSGLKIRVKAGKGSIVIAAGAKSKQQVHKTTAKGRGAKAIDQSVNVQAETAVLNFTGAAEAPASKSTHDAQRRYLQKLQTYCDLLPLSAIAEERNPLTGSRLTLRHVYIGLNTTEWVDKKGKPAEMPDREFFGGERDRQPVTALQAAARYNPLVILGDPGSGKSSFVNYLLAGLAAKQLDPTNLLPKDWPFGALLPVRVLLREMVATLQKRHAAEGLSRNVENRQRELSRLVQDHIVAHLADYDAPDFAEALLRRLHEDRCLVVFDGLDEAAPELRPIVREAVEAFCAGYPSHRVLVTCRVLSYVDKTCLAGCKSTTLAPFDQEKADAFVTHWYEALRKLEQINAETAKRKIDGLQRGLRSLPQSFWQNPLLLTTIANVDANNVELPKQRAVLYKTASQLLLRRWHEAKFDKDLLFELGLKTDGPVYGALREMAYRAHDSGRAQEAADIPEEKALAILAQHFSELPKPREAAGRFLDSVDRTAGLLIGRGGRQGNVYAFPHRTFQEYFAGCFVAKRRSRELIARLRELLPQGDYWQLAALLGIEHLIYNDHDTDNPLDVAYALCPENEPAFSDAAAWRGALWAALFAAEIGKTRIAADAAKVKVKDFLSRLQQRLQRTLEKGLLPAREAAEAGFVLGKLGDERPGVCILPPVFVELPGGRFIMGDEKYGPPHEVELSPFKISKYPITNAQFEEFIKAQGYQEKKWWSKEGWEYRQKEKWEQPRWWDDEKFNLPNQPVVGVSWFEAEAFCNWLTEKMKSMQVASGKKLMVRLPTEAEWEFAARGKEGRKYPWDSDEPTPERANYDDSKIGRPTAVGSFPRGATPDKIFDLAGNVWEWYMDWYGEYKKRGVEKNPRGPETGVSRVLRGGAYYVEADDLRGSLRFRDLPVYWFNDFGGFRVCGVGGS